MTTTAAPTIKYSIIVPTYNEAHRLRLCLNALQKQTINRDDYEIIVVDDGSNDNTATIALSSGVKCISQANAGPAAARNRGAAAARGAIIIFTDADCIAANNWLEEMVQPFNKAKVEGVKGAYRSRQIEIAARFAQAEFMDRYELLKCHPHIDMVDTYAAAFRRQTFIEMDGFDESFPVANNEDTDFSYRLASAGKLLRFNPNAIVYHTHPATLTRYLTIKFRRAYWRMVVYRRYPGKALKDSYTPQIIKLQTLLAALSFATFAVGIFSPFFRLLTFIIWFIILASSLPFAMKNYKNDPPLGFMIPFIVGFRATAFAAGSLKGIGDLLLQRVAFGEAQTTAKREP